MENKLEIAKYILENFKSLKQSIKQEYEVSEFQSHKFNIGDRIIFKNDDNFEDSRFTWLYHKTFCYDSKLEREFLEFIESRKDDIDKIRGLGLGADDYLTKPFSPSELVARVKAHMARYNRLVGSHTKENDIVEIRGIRIDKTARRVFVDGEERNFTTKEFDLLTFLAENPNHVFTKEEIFREIWDMDSIGDIATVTVHIKKIREKIETDTSKPQYIETIWGVGYRFKL